MIEEESGPQWVKARHVHQLQEMGFKEKAARVALAAAGDKLEPALEQLQVMWGGACEVCSKVAASAQHVSQHQAARSGRNMVFQHRLGYNGYESMLGMCFG